MDRLLRVAFALSLVVAAVPAAEAAESYDSCTGFIAALPAVVTTPGTWCLDADVATASATGAAIDVQANNVTIDCNGYKVGNLAAGSSTQADGIRAISRRNLTVRGCNLRGFRRAVAIEGYGGGHVVEDNRVEGATRFGITTQGGNTIVRRNQILDIGEATGQAVANAVGISATDRTDVVDNMIAGIRGADGWDSIGILVTAGSGSTVRDNAIGDVDGSGNDFGMVLQLKGIAVHDNAIIGNETTVSFGIRCLSGGIAIRDNTVGRWSTNIDDNCSTTVDNLEF